jgi:hypothetical protein
MTDDLLRQVLAAGLLQIAQRLDRIEARLTASQPWDAEDRPSAGTKHADLLDALETYFASAPFTAGGVIEAANDDGALFDAVHRLVDLDGDRPAVHLGRILARLPALERVGDRRGCGLFRVRR